MCLPDGSGLIVDKTKFENQNEHNQNDALKCKTHALLSNRFE